MSGKTNRSSKTSLSKPRRILIAVLRVIAALVVGGLLGAIAWLVTNQFALPDVLAIALTAGGGLIGAAAGWRWWDKVLDEIGYKFIGRLLDGI